MIKKLDVLPEPQWLFEITENPVLPSLEQLLVDSLYYPGCHLDSGPIRALGGHIYSFIYADYILNKQELLNDLFGSDPGCGFKYYHSLFQRDVQLQEVAPLDWRPEITEENQSNWWDKSRQEDCRRRWPHNPPWPYFHWSVWERNEDASPDVGPRRFSLLYCGQDMSAVYQALYSRFGIAPRILTIKGIGMGENWAEEDSFFKKVVSANPAGFPQYLLNFDNGPCWSEYEDERVTRVPLRYHALFKLKPEYETHRQLFDEWRWTMFYELRRSMFDASRRMMFDDWHRRHLFEDWRMPMFDERRRRRFRDREGGRREE